MPSTDSPKKENYQAAAADAIANQPVPDNETVPEGIQVMDELEQPANGDAPESPGETFQVSASQFVGAGVEVMAEGWKGAFGEGEGSPLSQNEKEQYNSLLCRASDYYGIKGEVSGTKGFLLEFAGLLLATVLPRIARQESREHFKQHVLKHQDEASNAAELDTANAQPNNDTARGDAISPEGVYTVGAEQPQGA